MNTESTTRNDCPLASAGEALIRLSGILNNRELEVSIPKGLLTVESAHNYLDIGRTSFYRLIKDGEIPKGRDISCRPHWRREDLDAFIARKFAGSDI